VYARVTADPGDANTMPARENYDVRILVLTDASSPPDRVHEDWDLCLTLNDDEHFAPPRLGYRKGWLACREWKTLLKSIRVRAAADKTEKDERATFQPIESALRISIIICTCREPEGLKELLRSLQAQSLAAGEYEVIVVNNAPDRHDFAARLQSVMKREALRFPFLKIVDCLPPGLSRARNAGLRRAVGKIVLFLDDDVIITNTLLEEHLKPYDSFADLGVAGGTIEVVPPARKPAWLGENLLAYWSLYHPGGNELCFCREWKSFPYGGNWSARRKPLLSIGGFRCRYGRNGIAVDSGEEIVAALAMQRLGYRVAANPKANVFHRVSQNQFSLKHLFRTAKDNYYLMIQLELDGHVPDGPRMMDLTVHGIKRLLKACGLNGRPLSRRLEDLLNAYGCFCGASKGFRLALKRLGRHPVYDYPMKRKWFL
jgi:glycosyltransferase involved in cell wall biosynthesis